MDIERIQELVTAYGPFAVGLGSTLDNTGIPIFFVIGMGTAHTLAVEIDPRHLLVAAVIGSIIGDVGTYAIGRYFLTKERILLGRIGKSLKPILEAGEKAMQRWGIFTVAFGRFIPYIGKVTPLLAGSYGVGWFRSVASISVGSVLLMGFMYVYADSLFKIISGSPSLVRMVSVAIGTALVASLYYANMALKKRSAAAPRIE